MITEFEIRRNIFHIFYGIIILMSVYLDILTVFHLLMILGLGIVISFFSTLYKIPVIQWFIDRFERQHAIPGWGALTFLTGCIIVLFLFEKNTAYAGIMVLTFGDSFSHLAGMSFGKLKHPLNENKLVEGTIAGIIFGFLGALLFVTPLAAFLGAFAGMFLEALEIKFRNIIIDDNIIVPISSSFVIYLTLLGYSY